MTTTTFHADIQRSRFAHLVLSTLTGLIPRSRPHRTEPAGNAAREAQQVREMAYRFSQTDPGFASDLYAAAARHEGQSGE